MYSRVVKIKNLFFELLTFLINLRIWDSSFVLIEFSKKFRPRKSSNKNSATWAFRIAKDIKQDDTLSEIDTYDVDFLSAKERISKMKIKYVKIEDPIIQTIFEAYLVIKTGSELIPGVGSVSKVGS